MLSTDFLLVDRQNLLSTGLLQVFSTSCNKPDFENLKAYFYTSAEGFIAILACFRCLKDNQLKTA